MTRYPAFTHMLPDELLYEGGHVAHISAYYERLRMKRIQDQNKAMCRRRKGSRT